MNQLEGEINNQADHIVATVSALFLIICHTITIFVIKFVTDSKYWKSTVLLVDQRLIQFA